MRSSTLTLSIVVLAAGGLVGLALGPRVARGQDEPVVGSGLPPVGTPCTVHLRRDALGLASRMVIPPSVPGIADSDLDIHGFFLEMRADWVVLQSRSNENRKVWVPREAILHLEMMQGK